MRVAMLVLCIQDMLQTSSPASEQLGLIGKAASHFLFFEHLKCLCSKSFFGQNPS